MASHPQPDFTTTTSVLLDPTELQRAQFDGGLRIDAVLAQRGEHLTIQVSTAAGQHLDSRVIFEPRPSLDRIRPYIHTAPADGPTGNGDADLGILRDASQHVEQTLAQESEKLS